MEVQLYCFRLRASFDLRSTWFQGYHKYRISKHVRGYQHFCKTLEAEGWIKAYRVLPHAGKNNVFIARLQNAASVLRKFELQNLGCLWCSFASFYKNSEIFDWPIFEAMTTCKKRTFLHFKGYVMESFLEEMEEYVSYEIKQSGQKMTTYNL